VKNPASVIYQFANAQTRHIDLVLLTKTTVIIVLTLSLTGFIAFAPRFSATLIALFWETSLFIKQNSAFFVVAPNALSLNLLLQCCNKVIKLMDYRIITYNST
jgi:hypothetical protein